MKKAILLVHGFKRNDVNDFEEVQDYIDGLASKLGVEKIYNEVWFENYKKETLNLEYFDKRVNEVSELINKENYDEIYIIGYSTGTLFSTNLIQKLNIEKINFYGIAPPTKAHILKWFKTLRVLRSKEKELKKKLGKERYARIKKAQHDNQVKEKYPMKIIFFMFRGVIAKRKKYLLKTKNAHFLVAKDDHIIKANKAIKQLSKNGTNTIEVKDFTHDLILRKNKQIFYDWMDKVFK